MKNRMWKIEITGNISISGEDATGWKYGTISIGEDSGIRELIEFADRLKKMYDFIDPKPVETHPPSDAYMQWHREHGVDPFPDWPNDGHGFGTSGRGQGGE